VLLSSLLFVGNMWWIARNRPPQPAGPPVAAAGDAAAPAGDAAGAAGAADEAAGAPAAAAAQGAASAAPDEAAAAAAAPEEADADSPPPDAEPEAPAEFITLGSVDPASPYRMLATLTNVGAAVRRVELASPRFTDLHDRTGYLGHLELSIAEGDGVVVNAVGAGTPAAEAGIRVGDVLLEAGVKETAPLHSPADLANVLATTRPASKLRLVLERNGAKQSVTAQLRRRPLEVMRPESENFQMRGEPLPAGFVEPPSYLLTLEQFDKETLKPDAAELPGVDLQSAAWRIVDRSADAVTFERRLPERGLTITKRFQLAKVTEQEQDNPNAPAYHLVFEVSIANDGDAARTIAYQLQGANGLPVEGWWFASKVGYANTGSLRDVLGRNFGAKPVAEGVQQIIKGSSKLYEGPSLAYLGVDAQYFAAALIPQKKDRDEDWIALARPQVLGQTFERLTPEAHLANVTYLLQTDPLKLSAGGKASHSYTLFVGPKRPDLLAQYTAADDAAYSLADFVYYGWFGAVAKGMVGMLHIFYGLVRNYGIAIIMLTACVRLCMFPVSRGMAKNMAKMQELKPEMDRIKERYKGDQQKQAQAIQQMYKKHNVNPVAGCLPMFIQLPVFIGLYRGLAVDIELRQAPLFGSLTYWCSNLAAPDMFFNWSDYVPRFISSGQAIFIFPGFGPYLNILPLVTLCLYLWQQHVFMPEPANEQAAMQQKMMKYMMFFMGLLFYKVPSGLCLYFIASSLWGIGERMLFPPPKAATDGAAAGGAASKDSPASNADPRRSTSNGRAGAARGGKAKKKR
jgi:YidC/Oxa1 family membrane protein insertase